LGGVANAATFQYSYDFDNGDVVSGMFDGTANGNLVTELSNISASYNGVAFNGSGSLFAASYDYDLQWWTVGNAYASFDGTNNNFMLIDSNYPVDTNFTNYIYSLAAYGESWTWFYNPHRLISGNDSSNNFSQWHLAEVSPVPEPETLAMMLLGLPMIAWTVRRKKSA
jgi:hypothetical protein